MQLFHLDFHWCNSNWPWPARKVDAIQISTANILWTQKTLNLTVLVCIYCRVSCSDSIDKRYVFLPLDCQQPIDRVWFGTKRQQIVERRQHIDCSSLKKLMQFQLKRIIILEHLANYSVHCRVWTLGRACMFQQATESKLQNPLGIVFSFVQQLSLLLVI